MLKFIDLFLPESAAGPLTSSPGIRCWFRKLIIRPGTWKFSGVKMGSSPAVRSWKTAIRSVSITGAAISRDELWNGFYRRNEER